MDILQTIEKIIANLSGEGPTKGQYLRAPRITRRLLDPSLGSGIPISAELRGTSSSTALPEILIPAATANKMQI